jgi:hypothetical protein
VKDLFGTGAESSATKATPTRLASGGGVIYAHSCGGECLVWDIISDGLLILECDCGNDPLTLASDLGIDHARLRPVELRIAARMREKKRTRKETPA